MEKTNSVYLISGPLGVGKSSVSKGVALLDPTYVRIEGDNFFNSIENIEWSRRLEMSWQSILFQTTLCVNEGLNVVIDFVVEEELPWFHDEIQKLGAKLYYVVLCAPEDVIVERLNTRGDPQHLERSLKLLEELKQSKLNRNHLLETSGKSIDQLVQEINSNSERYLLSPR